MRLRLLTSEKYIVIDTGVFKGEIVPKYKLSDVLFTVIAFSNIPDGGSLAPVGSIRIASFVTVFALVPPRAGLHIRS